MAKRIVGIAAGLIKYASQVEDGLPHLVDNITFGSFTLNEREGNKVPVYWYDERTRMSVNAVGLRNQGLEYFLKNNFREVGWIQSAGCAVRISLAPLKYGDLREMLESVTAYGFPYKKVNEIEVNAACPNHRDDDGRLHAVLAHDPIALETLMAEASGYRGRKAIKIAPCMSEEHLENLVRLCLKYGYESIVSGNTLPTDTTFDGEKRLSVERGGMAGAPLFDYALMQVRTLRSIIDAFKIGRGELPTIIGCGGIMSADNVRSFIEAGAERVQVATYYAQYGERGIRDLVAELV